MVRALFTCGLVAGLVPIGLGLSGCAVERHFSVIPGKNQVLHAESGDRFIFDLEEDRSDGFCWRATSNDSDVDVTVNHKSNRAEVVIRVHRGYDGPSTVRFNYRRDGEKTPAKTFAITLFKRVGDRAFWE